MSLRSHVRRADGSIFVDLRRNKTGELVAHREGDGRWLIATDATDDERQKVKNYQVDPNPNAF